MTLLSTLVRYTTFRLSNGQRTSNSRLETFYFVHCFNCFFSALSLGFERGFLYLFFVKDALSYNQ